MKKITNISIIRCLGLLDQNTSPSLRVIPQALRHWAMGKEHAYHEALLRDPVSSPAKSDGNPSFDYTPLPGPAISPRARLHFYQTLNDEAPAG